MTYEFLPDRVAFLHPHGFRVQLRQTGLQNSLVFAKKIRVHSWPAVPRGLRENPWLIPVWLSVVLALLTWPAEVIQARSPEQVTDCTTASPSTDPNIGPTPTVCVSEVIVTTDGISPDNRFSVSWISTSPETGQVQLVGGVNFGDTRGSDFSGITHYVQVSNLEPSTSYQFDIVSGANTYTNNGQHWSLTLGPALTPPTPDPIIGRVKNPDGSDATEALVYARVQRTNDLATSSLLSMDPPMTSDDGGFFHSISLSDARSVTSNSNYDGRFNYNPNVDKVVITAVGPGGFASMTVNVNVAHPRPGGVNVILTLGSGVVSYSTPTPTPTQPTSTPTPVTPTVTQTSPPLTATALSATETAIAFTATPTLTQETPSATVPRPTVTRRPPAVPTATAPIITIVPADQTQVAQATLESTREVSPEPLITRSIRLATETPSASSVFAGIGSSGSIFALLALAAFIGAAVLGGAALFVWINR